MPDLFLPCCPPTMLEHHRKWEFFCPFSSVSPPILLKKSSSYRSTKAPRKEICTICYLLLCEWVPNWPLLGSKRTLKMWGPFLRFLHIQEIFFQPNSFWEAEWVFCEGRRRSGFMCWVTDPHTEALPLSFFQLKVEEKNIRQDVSRWRFGKKYFRPRQMPISDMIGLILVKYLLTFLLFG